MEKPVTINLGCGKRKAPDEIGVDRYPESSADVLADLSDNLPFADNVAGKVICIHVLEHVPDLVRLIEEIHRILLPGGRLSIEVPYFAHPDAYRDPTHCRFFTWESFDYFVDGVKPAEYTKISFRYCRRRLLFSNSFWGAVGKLVFALSPRRYEKYYAHRFPASAIQVELEAI
ncbi:MAG TPA: class I SAM-dependent methyltransferase [archaeon]|nr:class I SAM-dependent methyltransferase [archaeon]